MDRTMNDEIDELDPIDEELVAYLDDELDSPDRARVERRLADDEAYRERLRSLQVTWDALDMLPKTVAGDAFAATTVEMVAVEEEDAVTQAVQQVRAQQSRRWLYITLASVAAAAIGFAVIYQVETNPDRALVRDLPVIERVDQLRNTPSVDFLKQLQQEGLFSAERHES
jgi:anti-sigma factor RsiW